MTAPPPDRSFCRGFHSGLRGVVLGRCEPPRPFLRRQIGSPATDRMARHRDMKAFREDVERRQRDVVRA